MKQKAFSLVELSIALIIIGLLVAGVSGGSKLIDNARIRGVIQELQIIQEANSTFQLTYSKLAGDMDNAYDFFSALGCGGGTSDTCNGNNNKKILSDGSEMGSGGRYREEHNFWEHLHYSGILTNITPVGNGSTVYISNNIKGLTISAKHINVSYFSSENRFQIGGQRDDVLATTPYTTYDNTGKILSPRQSYSIDKKLDDGIADDGIFISHNGHDNSSNLSTTCLTGTDYNLETKTAECFSRLKLEVLIN